jgi:hypothetical protein
MSITDQLAVSPPAEHASEPSSDVNGGPALDPTAPVTVGSANEVAVAENPVPVLK